jgi:hypothetical protein
MAHQSIVAHSLFGVFRTIVRYANANESGTCRDSDHRESRQTMNRTSHVGRLPLCARYGTSVPSRCLIVNVDEQLYPVHLTESVAWVERFVLAEIR